MNFKEILELIDKVAESGIAGVEVEQGGTKVRIEGKQSHSKVFTYTGEVKPGESHSIPMAALPPPAPAAAAPAPSPQAVPAGTHVLTSPIVGTFYRSASPDSGPFVEVGSRIKKGQVLCIIEAMKLMNEIESDVDGVVAEIYPSNAQPVEFGEPLFAIRENS
ncbi:MAG: acetyl-CoA carboxylase biotin carboxyl carrier protein [Acidobacteria bacterium]|nr:MAG: acetyl-CoA carboxylase biotin carboxyl carrier protein [Acidobacteriota bacterium]